jgi:flagellar biosynthesis protein FliQ
VEDLKFIMAALIHDAVKTALALLSGIICIAIKVGLLIFAFAN